MEKKSPLISVIVPVYNVAPYIRRCLDSIAAQTYPALEIIAVDDASTDGSGQLCDACAESEARLQVVHFAENRGPSAARNEGIRRAAGAYLCFVDADDRVEPELLSTLYASLREAEADVSACGADGIRLAGGPAGVFSGEEAIACMAREIPFNYVPWAKLYAAAPVKACLFDERIYYSEDILFLYELFQRVGRVSYVPDILYHYNNDREDSQVHSGVSVRKLTALTVHDHVCDHAGERFPEAALYFRRLSLDVDSRWAMLTVESDAERWQIFSLLKRLQSHIRRHYDRKALQLLPERKSRVAVRTLHASVPVFWGMASFYKYVKRWLRKQERQRHQRSKKLLKQGKQCQNRESSARTGKAVLKQGEQ